MLTYDTIHYPHMCQCELLWSEISVSLEYCNTWCVQVLRSSKEAFAVVMQSWRERCEQCVCLQGDYVEK